MELTGEGTPIGVADDPISNKRGGPKPQYQPNFGVPEPAEDGDYRMSSEIQLEATILPVTWGKVVTGLRAFSLRTHSKRQFPAPASTYAWPLIKSRTERWLLRPVRRIKGLMPRWVLVAARNVPASWFSNRSGTALLYRIYGPDVGKTRQRFGEIFDPPTFQAAFPWVPLGNPPGPGFLNIPK